MSVKISIIHPSRSRPNQAHAVRAKWLQRAKDPESIEYLVSVDNTDPYLGKYRRLFNGGIVVNNNRSVVDAINHCAALTIGNLLVVVSDDFDCPEHWDEQLLTALEGKSDYVVKTKDGLQPFIITLPIMDRAYYRRFGYVYHMSYSHMYCDSEMACVGWMLGCYLSLDIEFSHDHYTTGRTKKDAVNIRADQTYGSGRKIFTERYNKNFDIPVDQIAQPLPDWSGFKNWK